ncbi:MAG: Lrp/AsnC family transcriptional regulator [Phormidesmis sp. RL_2_1]|nr:Lrp/AsnC family transcriptional regulator [Phormidesmis sp. RL_2_1]
MGLDELDGKILAALSQNGRIRWSALAEQFGVSAPAIADRVRRLEKSGVIEGYAAQLNAEALGLSLTAFVTVTLQHPSHRQGFLDYVRAHKNICTCHHIIGEGDYLLKICCPSTAALEQILSEEIKALPGIQQTRTTIALSSVKADAGLPIDVDRLIDVGRLSD